MHSPIRIILLTAPTEDCAKQIAKELVSKKLAACVNINPGVTSIFSWDGKLEESNELLLIVKTQEKNIGLVKNIYSKILIMTL